MFPVVGQLVAVGVDVRYFCHCDVPSCVPLLCIGVVFYNSDIRLRAGCGWREVVVPVLWVVPR